MTVENMLETITSQELAEWIVEFKIRAEDERNAYERNKTMGKLKKGRR